MLFQLPWGDLFKKPGVVSTAFTLCQNNSFFELFERVETDSNQEGNTV